MNRQELPQELPMAGYVVGHIEQLTRESELPAINRCSINAQTNAIRMNCETIRMVMASLAEQYGLELNGHDTVLATLENIATSCGVIEKRVAE